MIFTNLDSVTAYRMQTPKWATAPTSGVGARLHDPTGAKAADFPSLLRGLLGAPPSPIHNRGEAISE